MLRSVALLVIVARATAFVVSPQLVSLSATQASSSGAGLRGSEKLGLNAGRTSLSSDRMRLRGPGLRMMSSDDFDMSAFEAELARRSGNEEKTTSQSLSTEMTGEELRQLVTEKWGRPFDTRIQRRRDGYNNMKYYLQVMWKHLYQQSFHMTEAEYDEQLDAVASLITEWEVAEYVREQIKETKKKPGIGVGSGAISGAVAVSIPLVKEGEDGQIIPGPPPDPWMELGMDVLPESFDDYSK